MGVFHRENDKNVKTRKLSLLWVCLIFIKMVYPIEFITHIENINDLTNKITSSSDKTVLC